MSDQSLSTKVRILRAAQQELARKPGRLIVEFKDEGWWVIDRITGALWSVSIAGSPAAFAFRQVTDVEGAVEHEIDQ